MVEIIKKRNGNIKKIVFILLLSVFGLNILSAAEDYNYLISNSEKWQDVYSVGHYASLKGISYDFLVSTAHGPLLLNGINKENKIRVITSNSNPYVFNYIDLVNSRGFNSSDEITLKEANTELVKDLDINNFVIVGDSYGFNAIAVTPYAVQTKSWVFLSNKRNIYEIDSVLSTKNVKKILIYGFVDREVREVLSKYNPEIIDNQDKFKDNIDIVNKFISLSPGVKQVILTNGEFIEKELIRGNQPVLFTGKQNVPDKIRDYLKESKDITIGVLIGNDLVTAATNIRRSTGINVMVKFARGARSQAGSVAAVEGLDLFPLPVPILNLALYSARYNKVTSQLEITYKSGSNVPVYVKGTITVISDQDRVKAGDLEPIFVSPNDFRTVSYLLNITSTENLTIEIYSLFGESSSSLDRILEASLKAEAVNVIDQCKFNESDILGVKYNKQKNSFFVKIKNNNNVDCWVDLEFRDKFVGFNQRTISIEGSVLVKKDQVKYLEIIQELTDEDLKKNSMIDLAVYSGEKENSLINFYRGKFNFSIEFLTVVAYATIIVAIIIIILIILIIVLKRKKDRDK